MARTQEDFLNVILRAQCCAADLAYKGLKEEMFLRPDRNSTYKKVRFIQSLIGILNRYYDVTYILEDTPCINDDNIEIIIQEVLELCDSCGCCLDRDAIMKDIAPPIVVYTGSSVGTSGGTGGNSN